jgi:uncharacterized protein with HEPN domain
MRDEEALLRDMLDSALRIQREIGNTTYDEFVNDETLQDAVVWRLMVIGEAAKSISQATRLTLPGLPFDDIARMRNFMAHVYWRIDYKIVWDTATTDVSVLIQHLTPRVNKAAGGGSTP